MNNFAMATLCIGIIAEGILIGHMIFCLIEYAIRENRPATPKCYCKDCVYHCKNKTCRILSRQHSTSIKTDDMFCCSNATRVKRRNPRDEF